MCLLRLEPQSLAQECCHQENLAGGLQVVCLLLDSWVRSGPNPHGSDLSSTALGGLTPFPLLPKKLKAHCNNTFPDASFIAALDSTHAACGFRATIPASKMPLAVTIRRKQRPKLRDVGADVEGKARYGGSFQLFYFRQFIATYHLWTRGSGSAVKSQELPHGVLCFFPSTRTVCPAGFVIGGTRP